MTYKYCISDRLVCDGVLNCDFGDQSDETMCHLNFFKKNVIAIAVVSAILAVTLIVSSRICCFFCKSKTRYRRQQQRDSCGNKNLCKFIHKYNSNESLKKKHNCCLKLCWSTAIETPNSRQIEITTTPPEDMLQQQVIKPPSLMIADKALNSYNTVEVYTMPFKSNLNINLDYSGQLISSFEENVNTNLKRNTSFQKAMYVKVDT